MNMSQTIVHNEIMVPEGTTIWPVRGPKQYDENKLWAQKGVKLTRNVLVYTSLTMPDKFRIKYKWFEEKHCQLALFQSPKEFGTTQYVYGFLYKAGDEVSVLPEEAKSIWTR